jgi:hypothetical protein
MVNMWKALGPITAGAFVTLALAMSGCTAQITVRTAPPPERVETVSAPPSTQHFWVKGHWQYDGERYVWVPGHWETRRTNQVWSSGHWRQTGGGWVWVEGRWITR